MTNLDLKWTWVGYDILPCSNEEFTFNRLYDSVIDNTVPFLNKEYLIRIQSVNFDGIPLDNLIVFDTRKLDTFRAVMELHSYILHYINKCNKLNKNVTFSSIYKEDIDNFDREIKEISLIYYI
jgi:hypothetical protein